MVDGDTFVTTQGVEDLNTCPQQSQDVASPAAALRVTSEDGHPVTLKGSEAAVLSPCGATAGPGGRQARVTAHSPEKWVRWGTPCPEGLALCSASQHMGPHCSGCPTVARRPIAVTGGRLIAVTPNRLSTSPHNKHLLSSSFPLIQVR